MPLVDVGTGTRVVFATTGFTAELVSLRLVGLARRALGTSHMGTPAPAANRIGNRTYARGKLVNPGQMVMGVHFNPDTNPPLHAPQEDIRIHWPIPPGQIFGLAWDTAGFLVGLGITDSLDEVMVGEVTVQLTTPITTDVEASSVYWEAPFEYPGIGTVVEYYSAPWES